ncbi:hypothetical protein CcrSwift_gp340 [Caulobacter phage CcrSwift]|uniref:Uncharacterized protein n=1 Tax=Caulobacter phage CcrSwift TaxID=2927984 RepID=K4JWP5_9CAUD|nr:hypothetical protein D870_gp015 [Caulobacter phage CcrSwift]YP_006990073.1 hypothetical protein D870_gp081 [Caulobacter phage CcrSwift]AFU88333.1 hypothetical protein CcrSwift_gp015 [Caulobacter phage CcrSwift]AFU88658.1 hypothetical protein CcrSwift_gp340 [Caulobacter phage CcrSwift]
MTAPALTRAAALEALEIARANLAAGPALAKAADGVTNVCHFALTRAAMLKAANMIAAAAPALDLGAVSTADLIAELYRRPVALCVFEAADVLSEAPGAFDDADDAGQWLASKSSYIGDAMSGAGWDSVRYHLTADGRATDDDEEADDEGDALPVAVTLEQGDAVPVVGRFATVAEAETFLASPIRDQAALEAGRYGIDAPHGVASDDDAVTLARRLGWAGVANAAEALRFLAKIEP